MDINIRIAKKADIPLVRRISEETLWNSISENQRRMLDKESWSKQIKSVFENLLVREGSEIFIAESKNRTFLGYIFIGEGTNMITGRVHGFIYDIFVREEYRGKGIGKALLEEAQNYCRKKGYSTIGLMVSTRNREAIKFYVETGFTATQMFMEKKLD